ncbi:MAG: transposase, partial [Trueperaceae bacterium]|nr:transposase [Trueperaceae bacterium]
MKKDINDETSSYLNQSRAYGRDEGKARVYDDAPKGKKERSSLIAAITAKGLEPKHCLAHPDSVNKAAFMIFLKQLLANLEQGSILLMDNWRVHHGKHIKELIESHDCSVRY